MYRFDQHTRMLRVDEHTYSGHVHAGWSIGTNPNGGYLLALALSALRQAAPFHADPVSVTVHYLRPGLPDQPCQVSTQILRSGRRLSTGRATLVQDGMARIEVVTALGDLSNGAEPALSLPAPLIPPPEQCIARSGGEQGVVLPLLELLDIRLHPGEVFGGAAAKAQVTGWVRFRDGRAPDVLASLLFADAFPPAVFGLLGAVGWVPTVDLTVHIRRRPAPGWMLGQFRTLDMLDGRLIEDGALWDCQGNLVAQSRQLALVRLDPAKN